MVSLVLSSLLCTIQIAFSQNDIYWSLLLANKISPSLVVPWALPSEHSHRKVTPLFDTCQRLVKQRIEIVFQTPISVHVVRYRTASMNTGYIYSAASTSGRIQGFYCTCEKILFDGTKPAPHLCQCKGPKVDAKSGNMHIVVLLPRIGNKIIVKVYERYHDESDKNLNLQKENQTLTFLVGYVINSKEESPRNFDVDDLY